VYNWNDVNAWEGGVIPTANGTTRTNVFRSGFFPRILCVLPPFLCGPLHAYLDDVVVGSSTCFINGDTSCGYNYGNGYNAGLTTLGPIILVSAYFALLLFAVIIHVHSEVGNVPSAVWS
jgi:hypothetical protein